MMNSPSAGISSRLPDSELSSTRERSRASPAPATTSVDVRTSIPGLAVCEQVNVEPVPAQTYRIHKTGVPSLMLAGSLDALRTPPAVQAQVSNMLGRWSQYVEFPRAAHGGAGYSKNDPASQCADEMIASFIDAPRQHEDTSCIGG